MTAAVLFGDATAAAIAYLKAKLGTSAVYRRVPNPVPVGAFLIVFRAGGTARNEVVDDAIISYEAWAPVEEDAHDLAQRARAYLLGAGSEWVGTLWCYRADETGGPAPSPDDLSGEPRYVGAVSLSLRGAPATP